MSFINCTPHPIVIVDDNGTQIGGIATSGLVPRISQKCTEVGKVNGIPLYRTEYGEVEGLPAVGTFKEGIFLIVSEEIRLAKPERTDLVSPAGVARDGAGYMIGCRGFDTNPGAFKP